MPGNLPSIRKKRQIPGGQPGGGGGGRAHLELTDALQDILRIFCELRAENSQDDNYFRILSRSY